MSLAQSLQNAVSGLGANARSAEIVAANLANLRTEGYGRRSLALSAIAPNGGVQVLGVQRAGNPVLLAERRNAQASTAVSDTLLSFHKTIERTLGQPGATGSLANRLAELEAALAAAAETPGAESRLQNVSDTLSALAEQFRSTSGQIQALRASADQSIARDVATLNDTLSQVASINRDITRMSAMGRDVSGLIDQRQTLIDKVAEIIPLREIRKDGQTVALYTMGGATLLDGVAAVFSFTPSATVAADSSALSGLMVNGRAVSTAPEGPFGGGRLAAQFEIRDRLGPDAQADLDTVARDLMTRLEASDPTRDPGSPGLLTDDGVQFDATRELGLSGRLQLNTLIDPQSGGTLWPLRDGIGATAPGPVGEGKLLDALARSLQEPRLAASGSFLPQRQSLSDLIGALMSRSSTARLYAEGESSFNASRQSALEEMEGADSVDSDQELQLLLKIETAYAANARVIQTVDEMLDSLLRI